MTDWREAGRKADAHRVRDLYRSAFGSESKDAARTLVIAALRKAGGTRVLDLWGGGLSANALVAAGLEVVSVEDGSLALTDKSYKVSAARRRRALETTATEDGYEARWGKVAKFASEADCAFLDFCGPWSGDVRRAIEACRHMRIVVVTLMTDHETSTGATTQIERRLAYESWLRLAINGSATYRHEGPFSIVERRWTYRRENGHPVWVFLLAKKRISLGDTPAPLLGRLDPEWRAARNARHREWKRMKRETDPEWLEHCRKQQRETNTAYRTRHASPEFRAKTAARQRASYARRHAVTRKGAPE